MSAFDRITSDPATLDGQPCIRGMRLTVRRMLEALATYPDREQFRAEYPELDDEDIRQAVQFAAASLDDKAVRLLEAARDIASSVDSWADFSNALFDPVDGLLVKAYPTREERQAFMKTQEYAEIRELHSAAIQRTGLVEGATPR